IVSGGKLQTIGSNAVIRAFKGDSVISGGAIVSKSLVEVTSGSVLTLIGGRISAGAIVEATSGGTAIVSGNVVNTSATLFARDSGSRVQIAIGAVVSGGIAEVGNGIVEIAGASAENVVFQSGGSGGLQLDGLGSSYTGKITGFGGSGHTNHAQFIDFTSV